MMELTVKLKSEDGSRKYSKCFMVYEPFHINTPGDSDLDGFVSETMKEWGDDPADVSIVIKKEMI